MKSEIGNRAKARKNQRKIKIGKIIIIFCLIIFIISAILFCKSLSSNKKDNLLGIWSVDDNTKYEFDGKGNGKLIVPLSEYKFIYTINNNELFIDFESESSTDTAYIYSINEDKLSIENIKDNSLKFVLQKQGI